MKSTAELSYSTFDTPAGQFALAVDPSGALVVTAFGGVDELRARFPGAHYTESAENTADARREVEAYFADRKHVIRSRVAAQGTPFQQKVWAALSAIPVGETRSYGALAQELKSSPRAIGGANARNPVCLVVPCHRLIGADGSLTGYAFGEELKRKLLQLEGALA